MNKLEFIRPSYSAVKSVNGMTGDVVIEVPEAEVDLTGYATEEYVAKKIAEAELAEGEVDLSAYYTKSETDKKIEDAIAAIDVPEVDLKEYATKDFVEDFVSEEISNIQLTPGPKGEDGYTPVKGVDYFDGKDGVDGAPGKDGSDYVLTDDDKAEIAGMVEVTGDDGGIYVGETEPTDDSLIWINPNGNETTQFATMADVNAAITEALNGIKTAEEGAY